MKSAQIDNQSLNSLTVAVIMFYFNSSKLAEGLLAALDSYFNALYLDICLRALLKDKAGCD